MYLRLASSYQWSRARLCTSDSPVPHLLSAGTIYRHEALGPVDVMLDHKPGTLSYQASSLPTRAEEMTQG